MDTGLAGAATPPLQTKQSPVAHPRGARVWCPHALQAALLLSHAHRPPTRRHLRRWYRAPECLLTDGYYNYKMDMWGVGCVFFEIMSLFPLFPGTNELDQIQKIHNILGTPPPELLAKMKKRSQHMDFNFPAKVRGAGGGGGAGAVLAPLWG